MRFFLPLLSLIAVTQAALVKVANFGANPTKLELDVYVPANVAAKPAIIVAVSEPSNSQVRQATFLVLQFRSI